MSYSSRPKKNNIWSDTLIEESLCSEIGKFSSIHDENLIRVSNRDVESYEYSYNKDDEKTDSIMPKKNHLTIDPNLVNFKDTKTENVIEKIVEPVKKRLGNLVSFDENKSRAHISVSEIDNEDLVAKEIAKYLNEQNLELILRCVKILGRKKALEILYATEDLQEKGGMLTSEGHRTRTPGGVYIQLVRKDDTILNAQRKKIFIEDALKKKKQKQMKRLAQQKKFNMAKKDLANQIKETKEIKENLEDRLDSGIVNQTDENIKDDDTELDFSNMDEENNMIYFDE